MGAIHAENFSDGLHRTAPKKYYVRSLKLDYSDDKTERKYTVKEMKTGNTVATFNARPLPGCCGVMVVYYLRPVSKIVKTFREILAWIDKAASVAKYGAVVFTLTDGEIADELRACPLFALNTFVNHKTGNQIQMFTFNTKAPAKIVSRKLGLNGE